MCLYAHETTTLFALSSWLKETWTANTHFPTLLLHFRFVCISHVGVRFLRLLLRLLVRREDNPTIDVAQTGRKS
jgi:hypothetical protein